MPPIHDFFQDLDRAWKPTGTEKIRLPIIGAGALLLQTSYERLTKDSDVLETAEIDEVVRRQFDALAGKGSRLSQRHKLYQIEALHLVDVVVSKLKRFHANDRSDIQAMVDLDLVPHGLLLDRLRSAMDAFSLDARAAELPTYVANLHLVERDFFGMDETEIELPSYIDC